MSQARTRKSLVPLSALLLLTMLLAACAKPASKEPPPKEQGEKAAQQPKEKTLIIAVPGDIDTFDPAFTVGTRTSQTTIQNTFDQLDQYKLVEKSAPDGYKYLMVDTSVHEPMLAESRAISPDGKVVTWKLRKDIKYHDGKPMVAQDQVDGYRRIFDGQGATAFLLSMGGVMDSSYFRAVDEYTVEMKMDVGNMLVLMNNIMHNTAAVDATHLKKYATASDPWGKDQLKKTLAPGNGPFIFEEYKPGDRVVLKANPDYYRGKPKLDKVIFKIVPDATQRLLLLKKGEVDMVEEAPVKELDALKQDQNIRVLSIDSPHSIYLQMSFVQAPFDNKLVRQAVAYAAPYEQVVKDVFKGYATRSFSMVPKGMPGSDPSFWTYNTDLNKAKELLAQAGYPDGKGLPAIKLSIRAGNEEEERTAVFTANNLKQIGMNVTIDKVAFAAYNELLQGGKLQMWVDTWLSWVNDPYYHLGWIVGSDSPVNYNRFKSARVDEILKQYRLSVDQTARLNGVKEMQKILADEVAHVYLAQPSWNVPMRKNVTGYAYLNDELPRFFYMDKQ